MVETVMALSLFLVVSAGLGGVLTSSVDAHGFSHQQSLAQEAADAQIEKVRALPYDKVGTQGGNPPGTVVATQSAASMGFPGFAATVNTSIHFVGDGVPGSYNQLTNYKEVEVTVTRDSDSRQLAREATYVAPPTRAPYGGINQVAVGVTVIDIGDNSKVPGAGIALQTGPSAPRSDTTDTNGAVLFAGLTANPTSGGQAYYNVAATLPSGYLEMTNDVTQVQLGPGQLSNLTLSVYRPATIVVNLTKNGNPYTGAATVTVTPPTGTPQVYTVSGGSGSIPNEIPNGQYTLTATTSDGLVAAAVTQSVPNSYPSDLTSTFDLVLTRPGGTLSVTASNGGTLIPGATINVTGGPESVTLTGTTDANGVVNFTDVPAGPQGYTVQGILGSSSIQQTGVVISANATTSVTLGIPVGAVNVTVTSGANPLQGATVTLTGPAGFTATGTTDGIGKHAFTAVGSGSGYTVSVAFGSASVQQTGVNVTAGSTTNVSLSMPTGSIHVDVSDGSSGLGGATVTVTGPNSFSATGTTNGSGVYVFANVGTGSGYTVTATRGAGSAQQVGLSVTSGSTTNVSLTLPVGSIQATVTKNGSPLSGAAVTVTGPNSFSATGTTNGSGIATFANVPAGPGYTVSASNGAATAQQTPVTVTAGATTNVSLAIPIGSIQVTVNQNGSPLAGATVTLTGPNGYSAPSGTTTGSGDIHLHERSGRVGLHRCDLERRSDRPTDRSQRHLGLDDVRVSDDRSRVDPGQCLQGRDRLPGRDYHPDRPQLLLGDGDDQWQRRLRLQRRPGRPRLHGIAHLRRHRPADRHSRHRRLDDEHQPHDPSRVDQGDCDQPERRSSGGRDRHAGKHERRDRSSRHDERQRHLHLHQHPGCVRIHRPGDIRPRVGHLVEHHGHVRGDDERVPDDRNRVGQGHRQERGRNGASERHGDADGQQLLLGDRNDQCLGHLHLQHDPGRRRLQRLRDLRRRDRNRDRADGDLGHDDERQRDHPDRFDRRDGQPERLGTLRRHRHADRSGLVQHRRHHKRKRRDHVYKRPRGERLHRRDIGCGGLSPADGRQRHVGLDDIADADDPDRIAQGDRQELVNRLLAPVGPDRRRDRPGSVLGHRDDQRERRRHVHEHSGGHWLHGEDPG